MRCSTPAHLRRPPQEVEFSASLWIVRSPLGSCEAAHQLQAVGQAVIVSSFGLCFQGPETVSPMRGPICGTGAAPVMKPCPPGSCATAPAAARRAIRAIPYGQPRRPIG